MGNAESQFEAAKSQLVGFYYNSLSGGSKTVDQCNTIMNSKGWTSSWRASDTGDALWMTSNGGTYLFPGLPATFIINTSTMVLQKCGNCLGDAQALQ